MQTAASTRFSSPCTTLRMAGCSRPVQQRRSLTLRVRSAQGGGSDSESTESLFLKELKRRGISNSPEAAPTSAGPETQQQQQQQQQGNMPPPPRFAAGASNAEPFGESQLAKSRALNSEGIEGLPARASELIKLGGSFFLAFGPFIALISLLFSAAYLVLGDSFVHGGNPSYAPPAYVDPYDLLSEPTVDPMVPLNLP